jgi:erythromycin esterase
MDEALRWIRATAIPIATVEAGNGFADLAPLRGFIGDARILSLGEATHGTREFFQLKHRLLEFCVSELGFTIFAIEASYPECLRINDYVLHGTGDPAEALAGTHFWTWDTEEVLALIQWMRAWNQSHEHQIKFYGFDMQYPLEAALGVLDYLRRVAPDLAAASETPLWPISDEFSLDRCHLLPAATRDSALGCIARIREAFGRERAAWVAATGEPAWKAAQLQATVFDQSARFRFFLFAGNGVSRDVAMAENVAALLDAEGVDAKAVLWAHNGHVAKEQLDEEMMPIVTMGRRLHELFGRHHRVIGFAFNQGSFQAIQRDAGLMDHTVPPAPEGSLDRVLADAGIPAFLIDLSTAPAGSVSEWLASRPLSRSIGAMYSADDAHEFLEAGDPWRAYDMLAFIERTTAARPVKPPSPRAPRREPAPAPVNLDLEGSGSVPDGWSFVTTSGAHEHRIAMSEQGSPAGQRCIEIARPPGPWRWGDGRLEQAFLADGWHGKRLRLSGAIRAQVPGPGSGAQLYIETRGNAPSAIAMVDQPVRSPQWARYTVELEVPQDAYSIIMGIAFAGDGAAWFGDLALECV